LKHSKDKKGKVRKINKPTNKQTTTTTTTTNNKFTTTTTTTTTTTHTHTHKHTHTRQHDKKRRTKSVKFQLFSARDMLLSQRKCHIMGLFDTLWFYQLCGCMQQT
jgi:hypothetical protein